MANQRREPEQRPSPEALLEAARREDRSAGRLKIFLGAAPGVGKTYEMLQSAHARLKAGADKYLQPAGVVTFPPGGLQQRIRRRPLFRVAICHGAL